MSDTNEICIYFQPPTLNAQASSKPANKFELDPYTLFTLLKRQSSDSTVTRVTHSQHTHIRCIRAMLTVLGDNDRNYARLTRNLIEIAISISSFSSSHTRARTRCVRVRRTQVFIPPQQCYTIHLNLLVASRKKYAEPITGYPLGPGSRHDSWYSRRRGHMYAPSATMAISAASAIRYAFMLFGKRRSSTNE